VPINDSSLDWKDLGLLVYLLSKPDGWQVNVEYLATIRKSGVKAIYSGMRAIGNAGYAVKKPNPKKGGWDWLVFDTPQSMPNAENRNAENRQTEQNPQDTPNAENRNAENRNAENGRQVNTEYLSNTDTNQILNTTITTMREGAKLNEVQREIFVWASTHEYWHKATVSDEEFLKALCSPKGGMRRQFEEFKKTGGDNNATHQQPNKPARLSAGEQVRRAAIAKYGNGADAPIDGECSPA
jgi:hypothetical protein